MKRLLYLLPTSLALVAALGFAAASPVDAAQYGNQASKAEYRGQENAQYQAGDCLTTLTKAQQATLADMRADGATRDEIWEQLEEWGIEPQHESQAQGARRGSSHGLHDGSGDRQELRDGTGFERNRS